MSSLRQVSDGAVPLQHFRSFALSMSDRMDGGDEGESFLGSELSDFVMIGKFVLAFWPFIMMAASSYALAAASAVSNVPNQILLFL